MVFEALVETLFLTILYTQQNLKKVCRLSFTNKIGRPKLEFFVFKKQ